MKKFLSFIVISVIAMMISGCSHTSKANAQAPIGPIYEIFVRSFADSNGDGIGDLNGVTEKLGYLENLGIKAIWLTPIFPSPSYHGYDVTDYFSINPQFGTMQDFTNLVKTAHKDGIKVLLDLVLNHTSNQNPWFIKSEAGDPAYADWYTWINPQTDYHIRYNPGDWYPGTNGKDYFAYFGADMPDLNYSNPAVVQEADKIGKFWLNNGADGFRLDAAPYIFSNGEEPVYNPNDNLTFWENFRTAMRKVNPNVYLVGEVWQNASVYSQYYQSLDSVFNFDLASDILGSVNDSNNNFVDDANTLYGQFSQYNPNFVDAPFLSNHDQSRSASQLGGNLNKEKLAAEILLTLPGNPFIYYGEEIGMLGVKGSDDIPDRTPFLWGDPTVTTTWTTDALNSKTVPLNEQMNDPDSLYNTYKSIISVRNANPALSDGLFFPYDTGNPRVAGYLLVNEAKKQLVLVLINLSVNSAYTLPDFPNAKLLYQSYGSNNYSENQVNEQSTIILQLPYNDKSDYIK